MIRPLIQLLFTGLVAISMMTTAAATTTSAASSRWDFNVFLGDKKLGKHTFEVIEEDGLQRVRSQADLRYRILFVSAYRYEHTNLERWSDNCLVQFDAETNDNGTRIQASGERDGDSFDVVGKDGTEELPACVMTFAYWNPEFLKQQRLLNPQSGEFIDVDVEQLPQSTLDVRGEQVQARPYRITANDLELTVWYSTDGRWLALESVADGGKKLRYELS